LNGAWLSNGRAEVVEIREFFGAGRASLQMRLNCESVRICHAIFSPSDELLISQVLVTGFAFVDG
jgi:hypothetical protein